MIPARIPSIIEKFYSERVWRIETTQNDLYITFDDGPHPTITPAVLAMLRKYDAKATFFLYWRPGQKIPGSIQPDLGRGPCCWEPYPTSLEWMEGK